MHPAEEPLSEHGLAIGLLVQDDEDEEDDLDEEDEEEDDDYEDDDYEVERDTDDRPPGWSD